jgi:hypothetical protein
MTASSITARLRIAEGSAPVSREDWTAFCAANGLAHCTGLLGGQTFQSGSIRASFGPPRPEISRLRAHAGDAAAISDSASEITFSTFPGTPELPRMARLMREAQARFGGEIEAGPDLRWHLAA